MVKCNICGSKGSTLYGSFPFFSILKCNRCGIYFADKFPLEKKIEKIYSKSYYDAWSDGNGIIPLSVELMKKNTFRSYLDKLNKYKDFKKAKILDIGCATGFLLDEAKNRGCDCWGVEINPFGAKETQKKFPNRVFNGILENSKFKSNFFDIVTMIDLIEHTKDPVKVMNEVRRILKKGGYVVLVTPNVGGLWSKILGKKWTNFKEEHLYYFKDSSLKYLINKCGFKYIYGEPVSKTLTLGYICKQLNTYKTPILSNLVKILEHLPVTILNIPFPIKTGDYLVIIQL